MNFLTDLRLGEQPTSKIIRLIISQFQYKETLFSTHRPYDGKNNKVGKNLKHKQTKN